MKKLLKNLVSSQKLCTFAPAFNKNSVGAHDYDRDLAQLVAHTSGGREVAGSSPVIPTEGRKEVTDNQQLPSFFFYFSHIFSHITFILHYLSCFQTKLSVYRETYFVILIVIAEQIIMELEPFLFSWLKDKLYICNKET